MNKPRILVCTSFYRPGFKGGGPIKSVSNIVRNLSGDFDFDILTLDRDLKDKSPYQNIKINRWNQLDNGSNVFYYSPNKSFLKLFLKVIREKEYDLIYINSLYSKQARAITLLNKFKLVKNSILIAPRGELEAGAMKLKTNKKLFFLKLNNFFKLYQDIYWHATNIQEEKDIKKYIKTKRIFIAANISDEAKNINNKREKLIGELKAVFVSRISPKKNILLSLKAFNNIKGKVIYDIYGPIEDEGYYDECIKTIKQLPINIKVNFKGEVQPNSLQSILPNYHYFIFPTLGENYGHVIYEALNSLVPVITTKNVPENDLLNKNIGFNLGHDINEWTETLQKCVDTDQIHYSNLLLSLQRNKIILDKQREKNIFNTRSMLKRVVNISKNEGFYEKRA